MVRRGALKDFEGGRVVGARPGLSVSKSADLLGSSHTAEVVVGFTENGPKNNQPTKTGTPPACAAGNSGSYLLPARVLPV